MSCKVCKIIAKWLWSAIVSLGMFIAIMAFHLISFVTLLLLSIGIVFGISLTFSYMAKRELPVFSQNILILTILSLLSKFHVIFYYKLIYPGDNYERACWGFLKIVTKIIYIGLASLSFTKILEAYFTKCLNGPKEDDILEGVNFRPAKILLTIWHNGNKYFLVSMAILVHLFSVSIYKDYTKMCAFVPFLTFRSVSAILLSLAGQFASFLICLVGFYVTHSWVPSSWKTGENEMLYIGLTQLSLISWILQSTIFEVVIEKKLSLPEKDQAPYYWLQNTNRGRILLLKFVLLPLLVCLFYSNCDEDWFSDAFSWEGYLVPKGTSKQGLFFLSVFCCFILHASKSLMLLKNTFARLIYAFWMCYFRAQELMLCCCDDDDDWLTDTSSGTAVVSELADEEPKRNASRASHGNKKFWRFWPETKRAREHYAEGSRNEADSIENVAKAQPFAKPEHWNGVGDTGSWLPVAGDRRSCITVVLDSNKENMKEHGVHRTRSSPIDFCTRA